MVYINLNKYSFKKKKLFFNIKDEKITSDNTDLNNFRFIYIYNRYANISTISVRIYLNKIHIRTIRKKLLQFMYFTENIYPSNRIVFTNS